MTSLPALMTGTDKQKAWAETLRNNFLLIVENELSFKEIETLYQVRITSQWWIGNKDKLKSAHAKSLARAAKASVTKHGSIKKAIDAQLLLLEKEKLKAERYHKDQEDILMAEIDEAILDELSEDRECPF